MVRNPLQTSTDMPFIPPFLEGGLGGISARVQSPRLVAQNQRAHSVDFQQSAANSSGVEIPPPPPSEKGGTRAQAGDTPETRDAVILCGGRGQRMGGIDKGLVQLNGQPLYQHVLAQINQADFGRIWLSANRNGALYAASQLPVLPDLRFGFPGPLAGIEAALYASSADWLLVLPCDVPNLPTDLLARLWEVRSQAPVIRAANAERSQPAICLIRATVLSALQTALDQGQHALMRWQDSVGAVEVHFDHPFVNLNSNLNDAAALNALAATK